jgi:superfamily I DNA/RNA helicase
MVHSFHSLGLTILRESGAGAGLKPDFRIADEPERRAALATALGITESKAARFLKAVSLLKRTGSEPDDADTAMAAATCRRLGMEQNWVDFDDLVAVPAALLEADAQTAALWRGRFSHLCVDEFQDVDEQQYRLLRCLAPADGNICVIGDPNQAIYGFRGADAACLTRFRQDFPSARTIRLGRHYRSSGTIVTAAAQVIGGGAPGQRRALMSTNTSSRENAWSCRRRRRHDVVAAIRTASAAMNRRSRPPAAYWCNVGRAFAHQVDDPTAG